MARGKKGTSAWGKRGRLPASVQTQADYYRSGRSSSFAPGNLVRDAAGNKVAGGKS